MILKYFLAGISTHTLIPFIAFSVCLFIHQQLLLPLEFHLFNSLALFVNCVLLNRITLVFTIMVSLFCHCSIDLPCLYLF